MLIISWKSTIQEKIEMIVGSSLSLKMVPSQPKSAYRILNNNDSDDHNPPFKRKSFCRIHLPQRFWMFGWKCLENAILVRKVLLSNCVIKWFVIFVKITRSPLNMLFPYVIMLRPPGSAQFSTLWIKYIFSFGVLEWWKEFLRNVNHVRAACLSSNLGLMTQSISSYGVL